MSPRASGGVMGAAGCGHLLQVEGVASESIKGIRGIRRGVVWLGRDKKRRGVAVLYAVGSHLVHESLAPSRMT